jgi:hypothetical protein
MLAALCLNFVHKSFQIPNLACRLFAIPALSIPLLPTNRSTSAFKIDAAYRYKMNGLRCRS